MFFNFLVDDLPYWLRNKPLSHLIELIKNADKELKYGLEESFFDIPINLVDDHTLRERSEETKKKYTGYMKNSKGYKDDEGYTAHRSMPDYYKYMSLLEESFLFTPHCLFAKKGISSSGNEILILCEDPR